MKSSLSPAKPAMRRPATTTGRTSPSTTRPKHRRGTSVARLYEPKRRLIGPMASVPLSTQLDSTHAAKAIASSPMARRDRSGQIAHASFSQRMAARKIRAGGMASGLMRKSPTRHIAISSADTTSRQNPAIAGTGVLPRSQCLGGGGLSRVSTAAETVNASSRVAVDTPMLTPIPPPKSTPSTGSTASGHQARNTVEGRARFHYRFTWVGGKSFNHGGRDAGACTPPTRP